MCNYAGSFVLFSWVVNRCAVKLIIDVGTHRLGAWQGLLAWELKMKQEPNEVMPRECVGVCLLHTFMRDWRFFGCRSEYMQSLWGKESSSSPFLLRPHFPVCHHSTLFQLSSFFLSSLFLHWPFGLVCLSCTEGETVRPRGSILRDFKLFSPEQRLVLSGSTVAIQSQCHPSFYRVLLCRSHKTMAAWQLVWLYRVGWSVGQA